ncbi:hypothetical protein ACSBR1_008034 [Camellia fascicularis]
MLSKFSSNLGPLDLAHNNLSGPVPRCFNNISATARKQNSSGDISYINGYAEFLENAILHHSSIGDKHGSFEKQFIWRDHQGTNYTCGAMIINLFGNHLIGRIPGHIGNMGLVESLDFSLNQLWGEIPLSMLSLTFLSHLNLSYNNLIGRIPLSTQLQSLDNSSFVGNNLCGPPLANSDSNMIIPKVGHFGNEEHKGFPTVWFFAILALGFFVGFWAIVGPLLFKMSWKIVYFQFLDGIGYELFNF